MGYLRFILAMCIVLGHLAGHRGMGIPSDLSVQAFFLISGFYQFLILDEKYSGPGSYRMYLSNRALRLYPSYAFIVIASIAAGLAINSTAHYMRLGDQWQHYSQFSLFTAAFLIFSNASMLFQDVVMYLHIVDGHLAWTPAFYQTAEPAYKYLLIPQGWSISMEIMFFIVAPLLVKWRAWALLAVVLASTALRWSLYHLGPPFHHDPWGYRFFPNELALFVIGGLLFRLTKRDLLWAGSAWFARFLVATLFCYVLAYDYISTGRMVFFGNIVVIGKYTGFLLLVAVSLPYLHRGMAFKGFNRFLGNLSYPIYICNLFVFTTLVPFSFFGLSKEKSLYLMILIILVLSAAMTELIEKPVDKLRQRRLRRLEAGK